MPHRTRRKSSHRLIPVGCQADDDVSENSSASSAARSVGSQASHVHCGKGLDVIEMLLTTMFGGCCRPDDKRYPKSTVSEVSPPTETQYKRRKQPASRGSDRPKATETRRRRGPQMEEIPQPPEIRRLALAEELQNLELERSVSLSFLFYQD